LIRRNLIGAVLAVSSILGSACGTGLEPQDREFHVRIEHGRLDIDPAVISVGQGDDVTIRIDGDEHGTLHLHGYDLEVSVGPGESGKLAFAADATGRFKMTFHAESANEGRAEGGDGGHSEGEDDHEDDQPEIDLGVLEVQPR